MVNVSGITIQDKVGYYKLKDTLEPQDAVTLIKMGEYEGFTIDQLTYIMGYVAVIGLHRGEIINLDKQRLIKEIRDSMDEEDYQKSVHNLISHYIERISLRANAIFLNRTGGYVTYQEEMNHLQRVSIVLDKITCGNKRSELEMRTYARQYLSNIEQGLGNNRNDLFQTLRKTIKVKYLFYWK